MIKATQAMFVSILEQYEREYVTEKKGKDEVWYSDIRKFQDNRKKLTLGHREYDGDRPDEVFVKELEEVGYSAPFKLFQSDDIYPNVIIPNRSIQAEEISMNKVEDFITDDDGNLDVSGAKSLYKFIKSKKQFKNGRESVDINIYCNSDWNSEIRKTPLPVIEEIGAIARMAVAIKKSTFPEYIYRVIQDSQNKHKDNNWTCQSCRYLSSFQYTSTNDKGMSSEQFNKAYVCRQSDIALSNNYNIVKEGILSNIGIILDRVIGAINGTTRKDRRITSCPYHSKNYYSKNLKDYITESPVPRFMINRFDKNGKTGFEVMLDGFRIDITDIVRDPILDGIKKIRKYKVVKQSKQDKNEIDKETKKRA